MKKVAILLEDFFDEQEVIYPYHRLREDYQVDLISSEKKDHKSKQGFAFEADFLVDDVDASDYDGVYIPGGFSPDYMRQSEELKKFVSDIHDANKPIAAICHGPWMLISSLDLNGKNIASVGAIKDDVINSGANHKDEEVVVDGNLVTSRTPVDLPANVKAFVELLG